jgi:hypothetical protein
MAVAEEKAAAKMALAEEKAAAKMAVAEEKAAAKNNANFLKLCLAGVIQRYYVERFFHEAWDVLRNNPPGGNHYKKLLQKPIPRMTDINRAIVDNWELVRKKLDVPQDVQWPQNFGKNTLYGYLSDQVHQPSMTQLLVGDKTPAEIVTVFEYLAKRYNTMVEFVDEESAASGAFESN